MEKNCHITKSQQTDTGGNPVEILVCYCGTTACQKGLSKSYPLPVDFPIFQDEDCDCEYDLVPRNGLCKKCEDKFYNPKK